MRGSGRRTSAYPRPIVSYIGARPTTAPTPPPRFANSVAAPGLAWHDSGMSEWGRQTYGEPCRGCGYTWAIGSGAAQEAVAAVPARLTSLLHGAGGDERHPDLGWTVTGYVAHVGDNLRIWAERLAAITAGGPTLVTPYDEDALAAVRRYDELALAGALWSLRHSVSDWLETIAAAPPTLRMVHPDRGDLPLDEVVRLTSHDAIHHVWDIERSLAP